MYVFLNKSPHIVYELRVKLVFCLHRKEILSSFPQLSPVLKNLRVVHPGSSLSLWPPGGLSHTNSFPKLSQEKDKKIKCVLLTFVFPGPYSGFQPHTLAGSWDRATLTTCQRLKESDPTLLHPEEAGSWWNTFGSQQTRSDDAPLVAYSQ